MKCAAVKFAKPWSDFSEYRDPNYDGSAVWLECPRNGQRGRSCWLNPRESGPEVHQGPGGVIKPPTLLGPILVWSQLNYQIAENHEVFRILGLRSSWEEERVWKWMYAQFYNLNTCAHDNRRTTLWQNILRFEDCLFLLRFVCVVICPFTNASDNLRA